MKKVAIRAAAVLAALAFTVTVFSGSRGSTPAQADPTAIVMFNPGICVALTNGAAGGCLSGTSLSFFSNSSNLHQAADVLGDNDGVVEPSDFAGVADFTGGQIHQNGGVGTSVASLAVVAFVNNDAPVTFSTNAGHIWTSADQGSSYVCDQTNGSTIDTDCGGGNQGNEDHAVVVYIRCDATSCPTLGTDVGTLTVTQDGVVFPVHFTVVGDARTIEWFTLETAVQAGVPNDAAGKPICPFKADLASVTKALGEAEKTVIVPRALDINGTAISGSWFHFTVDDAKEGTVSLPDAPTLNLGAFGYGAPNILCAVAGAKAGSVKVTASLLRVYQGSITVEPNAGGSLSGPLPAKDVTFTVVGAPATVTLAADPPTLSCDGTNTSTVSATLVDAAGNPALSGTKVNFSSPILATTNPIDAVTNDKGVATTVVTPLSGTTAGVPVTVSVLPGGVTDPALTQQILVSCTPGAPGGASGPGGATGGGGTPSGSGTGGTGITGPNTGTGSAAGAGAPAWWWALALVAGGLALGGTGLLVKRRVS